MPVHNIIIQSARDVGMLSKVNRGNQNDQYSNSFFDIGQEELKKITDILTNDLANCLFPNAQNFLTI